MENKIKIPTMAEVSARGDTPEVLFWVGCAGSFDPQAQKVTLAFAELLQKAGVSFAVLGSEESCTGDPAKRSGNEFLFQMQAITNIQVLNAYEVKKIVTACPHCFNTLKNEYPSLGGEYEVFHHTQFLQYLLNSGRLKVEEGKYKGKKVVFHDPCYLGRANGEYEAPRELLHKIETDLTEMKHCKSKAMCCGAGGGQLFKEPEKGETDINTERASQALATKPEVIATACPFCKTMLLDGLKAKKQEGVEVKDIAEFLI